MPDYRNSTVHALEIGLAFRRHPADKDYFLHGDKNIPYILEYNTNPGFGNFLKGKKFVRVSNAHISFHRPMPTWQLTE